MDKNNPYAHLTAKKREKSSFPTRRLLYLKKLKGRILDYGCGFGSDVEFLMNKGFDITGYDPHYFPQMPEGKFDTIICNYVLNVLLKEEQSKVMMAVSELLNENGRAYFTVRRDLKRNGFRMHYEYKKPTYQTNVVLPFDSILLTEHCEIYEYQHYNKSIHEGVDNCPFCRPDRGRPVITELATAYAILDKFPVNEGHTLIIPKRHTADYFDLSFKEQMACWLMVNHIKEKLQQQFQPDGFNIGINIGKAAGQTVDHVHIHVIPRFKGDVDNPAGGVRGVIAGKMKY